MDNYDDIINLKRPVSKHPRWVITCNFTWAKLSRLYSMNTPHAIDINSCVSNNIIHEQFVINSW